MARVRNPRGEGQRLRAEIVEAAAQLLAAEPEPAPVSLRGVARRVGIAPQSMYLHFGDKSELLAAVVAVRFRELLRACDAAAAAEAGPRARLRAFCVAYCTWGLRNPGHYRLLFESRATTQAGLPYEGSPGAGVFDRFAELVSQSVGSQGFTTAVLLWVALHGIVSLRWSKPGFPWPPVEELVDAFLPALVRQANARPGAPAAGRDHPAGKRLSPVRSG
jgi:AcrR family transcriptional regulator